MQQVSQSRFFSLILYILGFLLFWEWLRPLAVIQKGMDLSYFVSFAAFSFLLSYLRLPYWVSFPAKLLGMGYALHILYFYNTPIFDPLWIRYFFEDFGINLSFIINGNWPGLSDLFRSFLFFILLWIVSYLMHYWLIQARRLFLFFFVTIIYLTVLDSFTMYHADGAIVRTMMIGLVLIGLLRLVRIQEKEGVSFEKGMWPFSWFAGLCVLIVITILVGFVSPKAGPQWPDPVPFITKAANGYESSVNGVGNEKRIGYGSDDSRLGGPFQMDSTPVFTATTTNTHYWKIETRNTYTGKGWLAPEPSSYKTLNSMAALSANSVLKSYEKQATMTKFTDTIKMQLDNFPQLVYGGEPLSVSGLRADQLRLNQDTGKLEPELRERTVTPATYKVTYNYPVFSVPLLRTITDSSKDPKAIKEADLQLPKELPERVKKLAEKITENKTNRYDKAQAIVDYFNNAGYTYKTQGIPYPKQNQDYVDQFLFESKTGYCDNFSTSMVVLLRSINIPARWVKGFSQGTYQNTNGSSSNYQIKESDAHSWVEVYFPGSGWVPFEPTVGFTNLADFSYDDPSTTQKTTAPAAKATPASAPVQKQKQIQPASQVHNNSTHTSDSGLLNKQLVRKGILVGLTGLVVVLFIWLVLFKTRKRWLPFLWKKRFGSRTDAAALDDAFEKLMKLLELKGYKRKESQTLREFAHQVDRTLGTVEMVKLVRHLERGRYDQFVDPSQWSESKELWENMINSLLA